VEKIAIVGSVIGSISFALIVAEMNFIKNEKMKNIKK